MQDVEGGHVRGERREMKAMKKMEEVSRRSDCSIGRTRTNEQGSVKDYKWGKKFNHFAEKTFK